MTSFSATKSFNDDKLLGNEELRRRASMTSFSATKNFDNELLGDEKMKKKTSFGDKKMMKKTIDPVFSFYFS